MARTADKTNEFGTLLRTLARNLRSGTVLARSGKREKILHLEDGVVRELYARASRFRLGDILYRARAVEMPALQEALTEQRRSGRPVGEILVGRGDITERQLREATEYRLVEEVLEIYYWNDLTFEFLGESPERFVADQRHPMTRVSADIDAEEMVGRLEKTVADLGRFNEITPSLRDVYELTADAAGYLQADDLDPGLSDFLLLLDGRRDMKEVLRDMRMNRFHVLEFFYQLRIEGKIRAKNGFELLMLAENERPNLSPEKLLRLYERVRELGVEGFEVCRNLAELCVQLDRPRRGAKYYVEMARRALKAGDPEKASEAAHRALELFPEDIDLRRSLVSVLQKAGREEEGAQELRDLATVLRDQGELEEAQTALVSAAGVLQDPATREQLAEVLLEKGDRDGARRAFREAARLRASSGMAEEALGDLENAVSAEPDHLAARLELAECYVHCSRDADAIQTISHLAGLAGRLRPDGDEPRELILRAADLARETAGAGSDAVTACARTIAILGDEATSRDLWSKAADSLLSSGAFPEAVLAFREVLEIDPGDEKTREVLATALTRAGSPDAAGAEWRALAEDREAKGDDEGAREAWSDLLTVCPFDLDARGRRARCTEVLGHEEEAAVELLELGDVLRMAGRDDDAIEAFRRSRKLCGGDPRSLGRLISSFESLGLKDSGLEVRRALMKLQRERGDWPGLFRAAWDLRRRGCLDDEISAAIDQSLVHIQDELRKPVETEEVAEAVEA
jgi:tetratricopeptide (TPR) repeat protein